LFLAFSRLVIFDMMLALFVCGAIFAGYIAEQKQSRGWYAVAAASAAIATLIKGPVGFLVPGLVLGIYHALDRRWGALKRFFAPLNLLVFFGLTLPWFFGVNHYYRDFAYYGLVEESFHRYTTTAFRRTGPIYYYAPWLAIGMFTWTLLLPESIVAAWRARRQWSSADRLLIVWTIVVIVFFSASKSKRPDYILSAIVALGALIARVMVRSQHGLLRRATIGLGIVCLAGAAGLLTMAPRAGSLMRLPAENHWEITAAFTRLAVALLLGTIVVATAWWRRQSSACIVVFIGLPVVVVTVGFGGLRLYANSKSARALAEQIPPLPAGTEFASLRCFPTGLPFYRKQLVNVFTKDGEELTSNYIVFMLKKTNPWPAGVTKFDDREPWLAARSRPVFLLSRKSTLSDLNAIAAARGATATNLMAGWWGVLLPVPGGS
jgi:4-amino-4-deoxy-L-arabinose transferase-like glycosyltransferase